MTHQSRFGSCALILAAIVFTACSGDRGGDPDSDAVGPSDVTIDADTTEGPSSDAVDTASGADSNSDVSVGDIASHDGGSDADGSAELDADTGWDLGPPPPPWEGGHCAYFVTGEVDLRGSDFDEDGVGNGWDQCPNNPNEWLDSDRDGVGNLADDDMDGDGILDDEDDDRDGDGALDVDELDAGTDPDDPASIPELRTFAWDAGVLRPVPGWYRGDLHLHTEASHDSSAPLSSYIEPLVAAGLDFAWVTDHRVFEAPFDPAWQQDRVLFVPAIEWGGPGHANMGGIRTDNAAVYEDVDDIRRAWRVARLQGAVQSLNHYASDAEYWDAIFAAAPDLVGELDVMEVWNVWWAASGPNNDVAVAKWEQWLDEGHRIGAVGGSDAHAPTLTLAFPTTVVWAESLSVPGILDGIRRGRTYVAQSFPYVGPGLVFLYDARPELEFRIDGDGDGTFEAMLGDEVRPGPVTLRVRVVNAHGPVVVIRDGAEIARFDDHDRGATIEHDIEDDAPAGSWYRVQMRENASPTSPMLLLSSPIYVGIE